MSANNTEGYIAVWIGSFNTEKEFKAYIERCYTYYRSFDSQFEKDFELKYYDRDLVEKVFKKDRFNTIKELFKGASYLDEFIVILDDNEKQNMNVIIRIYDFKYENERKEINHKDNTLMFYVNIEYEKEVDLSWMGIYWSLDVTINSEWAFNK